MTKQEERFEAWIKAVADGYFDTRDSVAVGDRIKIVSKGKELEVDVSVLSKNEDGSTRVYFALIPVSG